MGGGEVEPRGGSRPMARGLGAGRGGAKTRAGLALGPRPEGRGFEARGFQARSFGARGFQARAFGARGSRGAPGRGLSAMWPCGGRRQRRLGGVALLLFVLWLLLRR